MARRRILFSYYWRGSKDLPRFSQDAYTADDCKRLLESASKHVTGLAPILLTNEQDEFPGWEVVPFTGHDVGGWSRVLETFRHGLRPAPGRRHVAVDLDTVFVGDADWLWDWDLSPVGLPLDPYAKPNACSGVKVWDFEGADIVWDAFKDAGAMSEYFYGGCPSEMALLRKLYLEHGWSPLEPEPKRLLSYKAHVQKGMDWRTASIVYFHGNPKPRAVKDAPWL